MDIQKQTRTPGPWMAWNRGIGWEVHHSVDADGYGISVNDGFRETFSEADAKLIAAAPDLLAALERIVSASDSDQAKGGEMWWAETVYPHVEAAKAIIAKAKGQA